MQAPIYVYDGVCVLCSRAVQYVLRHDTSDSPIRFVAIKSQEGRQIARDNGVDPNDPHTFIFVDDDGSYVLSDAVFKMAKRAGGPGRFIRVFRFVPKPVRDWFYARLANNRYNWFGKLDHCFLPAELDRHRFVLEGD